MTIVISDFWHAGLIWDLVFENQTGGKKLFPFFKNISLCCKYYNSAYLSPQILIKTELIKLFVTNNSYFGIFFNVCIVYIILMILQSLQIIFINYYHLLSDSY